MIIGITLLILMGLGLLMELTAMVIVMVTALNFSYRADVMSDFGQSLLIVGLIVTAVGVIGFSIFMSQYH